MVAAAVVGGALIGAAGTAIAGSSAASATRDATNAANSTQERMLASQQAVAKPYVDLGKAAMPTYMSLLGLGPQGSKGIESTLQSLPGYQFTRDQAIQDAKNAGSAIYGGGLSGNVIQGIEQEGAGLADSTYAQRISELLQPIQIGQGAAAGQAANIGEAGRTISGNLINQGNTMAGIDANTIAGITRSIGQAGNQYMTYNTLQNLGYTPTDMQTYANYAAGSGSTGLASAGGGYTVNVPTVP